MPFCQFTSNIFKNRLISKAAYKNNNLEAVSMYTLDNQIKICPSCLGWGELPGQEGKPCQECSGRGAFIQKTNKILAFDMPSFVDYESRIRKKTLKGIVIIIITISAILSLATLVLIILQLF